MTRALSSKRGSLRTGGFDAITTPIPGNVFACMEELGVENLRQVEDEIAGKCPQHYARLGKEDNHPSWSVQAEDGYFNCFSCGYKGPFVLLVKDMLGVTHAEAAQWIRARGTIERVKRRLAPGTADMPSTGPVDTSTQFNEASLALFTDPPVAAREKRAISLEACQYYGVLWDTKIDAWITPIRDASGRMRGWQEKNERHFRNRPRDVKKSETLFGLSEFDGGRALVVESPLDVPRIFTAGLLGGLSTWGSAVSQTQIDLLIEHADSVVFCLDADASGDKQSEYLRMYFNRRGFPCKFMDYSHVDTSVVSDPGEMTDEEILQGVDRAYSGVVARF